MRNSVSKLGVVVLTALAAGCTTMGTGSGSTAWGKLPVKFAWKSSDGVSGTMAATLPRGTTYTGRYFEITRDTTVDSLGPLWYGWGPGWRRGGWGYWGAGPDFVTRYSGRVVANLSDPGGKHMRCIFRLVHPYDGMAGGGSGQCQLPSGKTLDASFPS